MYFNKYNPDVINTYKNIDTNRSTQYKITNEPYKIITNRNDKITDKKDILDKEFNELLNERNIVDKKIDNKIDNKIEEDNEDIDNINDYDDLKSEFNSIYKNEIEEINKDRQKMNSLLNSLKDDGLI